MRWVFVRACVCCLPIQSAKHRFEAKGWCYKSRTKYDFTAYGGEIMHSPDRPCSWRWLLGMPWLQRSAPGSRPSSSCTPPRPEKHCPGLTTMWSTFSRQRIPAGLIPPFFQPSPSDRWDQKCEKKKILEDKEMGAFYMDPVQLYTQGRVGKGSRRLAAFQHHFTPHCIKNTQT